ncbi:MAG: hypothetical protein V3W22_07270, partial [Thermoplasmata archaeon]
RHCSKTSFRRVAQAEACGSLAIETVFFYIMNEGGRLRIEQDRHITGLFHLDTWVRLMREAGFDVEKWPYPVHDDGREAYLLVGELK